MNIVYLLDPKTQISYAVDEYGVLDEALRKKEELQVKYPANLFFYTANAIETNEFISVKDALLIVNGKDIYSDVQS